MVISKTNNPLNGRVTLPLMRYNSTTSLPSSRARDGWHSKWKLPMFVGVIWGIRTTPRVYLDDQGRKKLEYVVPEIHRANKYLNYLHSKLNYYWESGDIRKFFSLVNVIMIRSVAFQLLVLKKSDPTWFWKYPKQKILNSIDFYRKFISQKRATGLHIKRLYILKKRDRKSVV